MHVGFFPHQVNGRIVFYSLQYNTLKEYMVFCMTGEGWKFARMKQLSHFTKFALICFFFLFIFFFFLIVSLFVFFFPLFHYQQEGSLCAQHCLNNLLQGEYFSPVELSSIAQQLDEEERMRMAEGGVSSEEYRTFLQVKLSSLEVA